jgi:hypothetical protein
MLGERMNVASVRAKVWKAGIVKRSMTSRALSLVSIVPRKRWTRDVGSWARDSEVDCCLSHDWTIGCVLTEVTLGPGCDVILTVFTSDIS